MIVLHFDLVINLFYFVQIVKKTKTVKNCYIIRKYKTVLLEQHCLRLTKRPIQHKHIYYLWFQWYSSLISGAGHVGNALNKYLVFNKVFHTLLI